MARESLTSENLTARLSLPIEVMGLLSVGAELLVSQIDRTNGRITVQIPVGQLAISPDVHYTFRAYENGDVECHWLSHARRRNGRFKVKKGSTQDDAMGELAFQVKASLASTGGAVQ